MNLITADKLQIILTRRDMEEYSVRYDRMSYSDEETKDALLSLLEKARKELGFSPRDAKLFIEIYPGEAEGCVIYITAMRRDIGRAGPVGPAPVVFEFADAEALISGAVQTGALYGRRILMSSLYLFENKYRLIVYPLDYSDRLSIYFLSEYARLVGEGEILAAFTREHGSELIGEDALDILCGYFEQGGRES